MEDNIRTTLVTVCRLLEKYNIKYMVVGGTAVALNGYYRHSTNASGELTDKPDLDIWYNPTYENYFSILKFIEELGQDISEFKNEQSPNPEKSFFKLNFEDFIYERGVDEKSFAIIRSKGDQALFGGKSTNDMKRILKIPGSRPLADFLPTLTIKAKDFATELTSHNVVDKDLKGDVQISQEHIENNKAVRAILRDRGVIPENLPIAEDVKKVQRRIESEEKKVLKEVKKIQDKKKK